MSERSGKGNRPFMTYFAVSAAMAGLGLSAQSATGSQQLEAPGVAPGYAQLLSIPVDSDLSAATYNVNDEGQPATIRVFRLPYTLTLKQLRPGLSRPE